MGTLRALVGVSPSASLRSSPVPPPALSLACTCPLPPRLADASGRSSPPPRPASLPSSTACPRPAPLPPSPPPAARALRPLRPGSSRAPIWVSRRPEPPRTSLGESSCSCRCDLIPRRAAMGPTLAARRQPGRASTVRVGSTVLVPLLLLSACAALWWTNSPSSSRLSSIESTGNAGADAAHATFDRDLSASSAEVERLSAALSAAKNTEKTLRTKLNDLSKRVSAGSADENPHAPWSPSEGRDALHPELAARLRAIAPNGEVLVALSNKNYAGPGGMLGVWLDGVNRSGVKNAMVLALDDETRAAAEAAGVSSHRINMTIPESQANAGSNHAVSALKFRALRPMLELGYSVLLSDVDIVTLDDPFKHLVRDSDVEGLSDGWTEQTAYGYNDVFDDPKMGWSRYAHSMRVFVINSGLFYIRPTPAAMALIDLVIARVENENGWDQALFNECIFFPSRPGYVSPGVTRRIMDYMVFVNSKVLFTRVRHEPELAKKFRPAMVHVNYHPDKLERMKAIVRKYVDGDEHALDKFPDGSQ